jgi:hypothetical protein
MTPPAQRRMRRPSESKATSPAFASWASLQEISLTLTLMYVMFYPLKVFLYESSSLRMPFATKTSCFARFFCENKKLNLELKSFFSEIASL